MFSFISYFLPDQLIILLYCQGRYRTDRDTYMMGFFNKDYEFSWFFYFCVVLLGYMYKKLFPNMSIQQSNIRLILPTTCNVSFSGESEDSWSPSPSTKNNKAPEEREAVQYLYFFSFCHISHLIAHLKNMFILQISHEDFRCSWRWLQKCPAHYTSRGEN